MAGGTRSGAALGGVPVGFRYAGPACSDLAAGHLQGPAQTVTQRRTTSFPWSPYVSKRGGWARGVYARAPMAPRGAMTADGLPYLRWNST